MIRVFVTGGTFDKEYNEVDAVLAFRETHVPKMLELGRCRLDVEVQRLLLKDSLDLTDADRARIVTACQRCDESRIVISHGTDTMVDTAQAIAAAVRGFSSTSLTSALPTTMPSALPSSWRTWSGVEMPKPG